MGDRKHWDTVYKSKDSDRVSWFRPHLDRSLAFLDAAKIGRAAGVIDGRGGASTLVDDLLGRGYTNVTVLDLSVLDVRPTEEYRAGHLPGTVCIPLAELTRRGELPRVKEIVAYCRGPYCVLAFRAVEILRARRRKARRLEDGFPEWRASGMPIEFNHGRAP